MNLLKKLLFLFVVISLFPVDSKSQENTKDSLLAVMKNFHLTAYMDVYYSYDYIKEYSKPDTVRIFSSFAPYNNEFRLNLAYVLMRYENDKVRANLGFRAGDMPLLLTPVDKRFIQYIKEANFGTKLGEKTWLDLGYMPNPVGIESSVAIDNFLSSISLCGYLEPSSLLGIKLSHEFSKKLRAALLVYNSYSIASANNNNKVLAINLKYTPSDDFLLTFNSTFGDEGEDIVKLNSYNNIFCKYSYKNKVDFIAQLDFSAQGNSQKTDSTQTAYMVSGLAVLRYKISPKFNISSRFDYISDPDGFMSNGEGGSKDNLKAYSFTLGIEYRPFENIFFRIENQHMHFNQKLYDNKDERYNILLSSGIKL